MLRENIYALAAVFCMVTAFFFLTPVWNTFFTSLIPIANTEITDPYFHSALATFPYNLNTLIQYTIVVVLIGLGIYLALVPFMKEYYTPQEGF